MRFQLKIKLLALIAIFILCFTGLAQGQGLNFNLNSGMENALKAINADTFRSKYGVDGSGIKVAVIDTGIDVSHPDLQKTTSGKVKVVDFIDFTDEGYVSTRTYAQKQKDIVMIEGKEYKVKNIKTRSGFFKAGFFCESQIDKNSPINQDINRNGKNDDIFAVLIADSFLPQIYDTVYVDTNQNLDFSDEKPLRVYSENHEWGVFGKDDPKTSYIEESSFVIACIDPDGDFVKIGFDGNGHGTHVAGIIGANGYLKGTAPGAEIIAIKVIGSSGDGNWEDIFEAIEYAGRHGADIINVSIGNLISSQKGHNTQLQILEEISHKSNALVVIASGNSGPGLGTAYDAGNHENIITVGAYMSPEMWSTNYNVSILDETLWYYTGVGHSSSMPTVVAPSSVISTVNRWDSDGYFLMDGTSMAAPFVSGSCALILHQAEKEGIEITAAELKRAIEKGARKIEGYLELEQGFGLLDVEKSWEILKNTPETLKPSEVDIKFQNKSGAKQGVTFRNKLKGQLTFQLENNSDKQQIIKLKKDKDWVNIDKEEILLSQDSETLKLSYNFPKTPGLYTAKIYGFKGDGEDPVLEFLTSAVVPYDLTEESTVSVKGKLPPSRWDRYFVKTVPGMTLLDIELTVADNNGIMGRSLIYVYNPEGQKVYTDVAGADYISPKDTASLKIEKPESGIWEIVVVSDYNLSDFGATETEYDLTVKAEGIFTRAKQLYIAAEKGETYISREILLKNGAGTFRGRVEGMGLARENEGISYKDVMIKDGEFTKVAEINIPENAMSFIVELIPQGESEGDLDLYLYRRNDDTGLYEEAGYSTKIDDMEESIYLTRPEPGKYVIYVDGFSIPEGISQVWVKTQLLRDNMDVYIKDLRQELKPGQFWKTQLLINPPLIGSDFVGYIAIKDEHDNEISQIPLRVAVGKKSLDVKILPDGNIQITEADTGRPVDTAVNVNGIEYPVVEGRVKLPAAGNKVTIEIYDDRYAPLYFTQDNYLHNQNL